MVGCIPEVLRLLLTPILTNIHVVFDSKENIDELNKQFDKLTEMPEGIQGSIV